MSQTSLLPTVTIKQLFLHIWLASQFYYNPLQIQIYRYRDIDIDIDLQIDIQIEIQI